MRRQAAMTAAVTAKASADDADAARVNAATMQTNESSGGHAYMARHYAGIAEDERVKAEMASAAAAAAEDLAAVTRALVDAENAMAAAETASAEAVKHAGLSMAAARGELLIDGTVKAVGETTIDANAGGYRDDHRCRRDREDDAYRPAGGRQAAHAHGPDGRTGNGRGRNAGCKPRPNSVYGARCRRDGTYVPDRQVG